MDEWTPGPAEDVEELEFRIDELRDSIARSRRLMAAGRVGAGVGAVLLLALMIGVLAFAPARVVFALALMIGGVVLAGSSKSSTEQLERSLERAERQRNAAIDALGLVTAGEPAAAQAPRVTQLRKPL
jgi:hypothetical protein